MKMEANSRNKDSFYITCTPSSGLAQVFDAVIQAYYDDITTLKWCVENDTSSYPYKIYIECGKTPKKKIGVAQKQSDGQHKFCNFDENYKGGNEFFYRSVRKKFGDINASNLADFQSKYMNFTHKARGSDGNDDNTETAKRINAVTNYTVQSCTVGGGTAVDPNVEIQVGTFRENPDGFDIQGACKYIRANARPSYKPEEVAGKFKAGECAKAVRCAIMYGGGLKPSKWPVPAKEYASYLPEWGFKFIGEFTDENYSGKKQGDIAVMTGDYNYYKDKPPRKNNAIVYGHICMFAGDAWYSDYKQKNITAGYQTKPRPFKVFRFYSPKEKQPS